MRYHSCDHLSLVVGDHMTTLSHNSVVLPEGQMVALRALPSRYPGFHDLFNGADGPAHLPLAAATALPLHFGRRRPALRQLSGTVQKEDRASGCCFTLDTRQTMKACPCLARPRP